MDIEKYYKRFNWTIFRQCSNGTGRTYHEFRTGSFSRIFWYLYSMVDRTYVKVTISNISISLNIWLIFVEHWKSHEIINFWKGFKFKKLLV